MLSEDEAKVLDKLVDLIIPETDIPGAKSLNVPMFVERFMQNVSKKEERDILKKTAGIVLQEFDISEENPVKKIKIEEYDAFFGKVSSVFKRTTRGISERNTTDEKP